MSAKTYSKAGWIVCVSDYNSKNKSNIVASCTITDSPFQFLKSTSPDGKRMYVVHGLAYVSDTERALSILVKALDKYNPFKNIDFDHGLIHVPSKQVITQGFSKFVTEMNSSGSHDNCAIPCRLVKGLHASS